MPRSVAAFLPTPLGDNPFLEDKFTCPISCEIMRRPVVAQDGITYDQSAIENWLRTCSMPVRSPVTRAPMQPHLVTAYLVRELMEAHATCKLALLRPTHGTIQVSRGPLVAGPSAPHTGVLDLPSVSERLQAVGFLIATSAMGTLLAACLAGGAVAAGWREDTTHWAHYGAVSGSCGALAAVVTGYQRPVLTTLAAATGATVFGISCAMFAAVARQTYMMWHGLAACSSTATCLGHGAYIWGTGAAGAAAGATVGYQAACALGVSVFGWTDPAEDAAG